MAPNLAIGTAPRALHVKLRDGFGDVIHVEMFCVQVSTLVARSHYVGIREFSDYACIPECRTFDKKKVHSRSRRGDQALAGPKEGTPADTSTLPSGDLGRDNRADDIRSTSSASSRSSSSSEGSGPSLPTSPVSGGLGLGQSLYRVRSKVQTSDVALQLALVRLMRMCSEPACSRLVGSSSSACPSERPCCPFPQSRGHVWGQVDRLAHHAMRAEVQAEEHRAVRHVWALRR